LNKKGEPEGHRLDLSKENQLAPDCRGKEKVCAKKSQRLVHVGHVKSRPVRGKQGGILKTGETAEDSSKGSHITSYSVGWMTGEYCSSFCAGKKKSTGGKKVRRHQGVQKRGEVWSAVPGQTRGRDQGARGGQCYRRNHQKVSSSFQIAGHASPPHRWRPKNDRSSFPLPMCTPRKQIRNLKVWPGKEYTLTK